MIRSVLRTALRIWGGTNLVPWYFAMAVDRYGPRLAAMDSPLTATLPNGLRIRCNIREHIQRAQWFFGAYEPIDSYLVMKLLQPGMNVIDAGANVGQYSLLASTAVGPSGSVHAFEPIPCNIAQIRWAVEANGLTNLRINAAALWHEATTLRLGRNHREELNDGVFTVWVKGTGEFEAQAIRLDDYVSFACIDRVDLIKMDIEGSEAYALRGAWSTLERDRPVILMEVIDNGFRLAGADPAELSRALTGLGYRFWRIGSSAATSGPVPDIASIDRANVLIHTEDLPPEVTSGWDLRTALRWSRSSRASTTPPSLEGRGRPSTSPVGSSISDEDSGSRRL